MIKNLTSVKNLAIAVACSSLFVTGTAFAGVVAGVGYAQLDADGPTLGVIVGSIGYQYEVGSSNFSLTPQLRVGFGMQDDSITESGVRVKIDVDKAYGVDLRGQWDFDNTYFFVAPSYINYEIEGKAAGITVSEDSWEFGAGIGAGLNLSDNASVELSYEHIDEADAFVIGFRYKF
ncbi:MAG: outer membrane beta-barrel protein [Pseudohongiellaceae bacterium]